MSQVYAEYAEKAVRTFTTDRRSVTIVDDIKDCVKRGQPVLVGTTTVEVSELISRLLKRKGINHIIPDLKGVNPVESERPMLLRAVR